MSSGSSKKKVSGPLVAARGLERRLAANFRLYQSRLASSATGSLLDNSSKLLQILAVVGGAVWVLKDYREFKKQNNDLINKQIELANKTAQLTQSSIQLNDQLSQLKLVRATEGRLEITSESSAVQAHKFDDGTHLYRYQASIQAKNVSDAPVVIPAMVIEIFLGTTSAEDNLKEGAALLVNQPSAWLDEPKAGAVEWRRIAAFAQRLPEIDDELKKLIDEFPTMSSGFVGDIAFAETQHWNSDFVLRAHPHDMAGSVITFWTIDQKKVIRRFTHTRTELLSEAQDAVVTRGALGESSPPVAPAITNRSPEQ
jgi:hypothetical protein